MPEIVGAASPRDLAARALFSATEIVRTNKFETELGRSIPQTKYSQYAQLYQSRFHTQVVQLAERLTKEKAGIDLSAVLENIDAPDVLDSWNTRLQVEPVTWYPQGRYYLLHSAGPDKQFQTADDLTAYVEVRTGKIGGAPMWNQGSIDVDIEHDHGMVNGRAEISG
jgi:hypothetical protein